METGLGVAAHKLILPIHYLESMAKRSRRGVRSRGTVYSDAEPGVIAHRARGLALLLYLLLGPVGFLLRPRAGEGRALDRLEGLLDRLADRGVLGRSRRLVHLGTWRLLEHRPAALGLGSAHRRRRCGWLSPWNQTPGSGEIALGGRRGWGRDWFRCSTWDIRGGVAAGRVVAGEPGHQPI